jgi:hypothetical protein
MQRRQAVIVPSIDIDFFSQQQFYYGLMASIRCQVQRSPCIIVQAGNQLRIIFEQRLDLCQVSVSGRVMNLAAEGRTAASQRHQQNGRLAVNLDMGMTAKKSAFIQGCPNFLLFYHNPAKARRYLV